MRPVNDGFKFAVFWLNEYRSGRLIALHTLRFFQLLPTCAFAGRADDLLVATAGVAEFAVHPTCTVADRTANRF